MKLRLPKLIAKPPTHVRTPLPGFDPIYYLYWYPDVRAAGLDPLEHYLFTGWKEGRDPSAGFSTSGYLAANPDVAGSGHNPLVHFVNTGFAEGRGGYLKDPSTPAPRPDHTAEPVKLLKGPDTVDPPAALQGFVDEINRTSVRGWALPHGSSQAPAEVEIVVNDTVAGRVIASEFRPDLDEERIGDARHGFNFKFSSPLESDATQQVIVRRSVDGFEIGRSIL
jgi:hypothetical protein